MNTRVDTEPRALETTLAILRRRWWIIALTTILVAAAAFVFSKLERKEYTATTTVQVLASPQVNPDTGLPLSASSTAVDPTVQATAIQLISRQPAVAAATARTIGHGLTPGEVQSAIGVSQQTTTNLVNVSATSTSPALAAAIANTYVSRYISTQNAQARASLSQSLRLVKSQIRALPSQSRASAQGQALQAQAEALRIAMKIQNGGVQLVTSAATPSGSSSPKVTRNAALGIIVGLLLGLGIAFLLERLDRRIKSVEELEHAFRLPLLAAVPQNSAFSAPPVLDAPADQPHKEVFRLLRAYLRYFNVDKELRLLMVTSAMSGDGKTTVAYNLAEAAQEAGTKTLLLETDLRRPDLARHYGLAAGPGLSEVLTGGATAHDAVQPVAITTRVNGTPAQVSLDVLVAGQLPPNPAELLESQAMVDVLAWASEHYGMVIIDTAPVAVVSDAMPLLPKVDGVLLVSQVGRNSTDAAAFFRDRLTGVNAPLLGVVANAVREKRAHGYGYGYGGYKSRNAVTADTPAIPASLDSPGHVSPPGDRHR
jgi:receptor protein-tyrosine kinase